MDVLFLGREIAVMRMRKLALLVLVVVFGGSSGASAVPIEWTVASGGNGHFYELVTASFTTWSSARADAQAIGAGWDLASIASEAEENFIISLLPSPPRHGAPLGI